MHRLLACAIVVSGFSGAFLVAEDVARPFVQLQPLTNAVGSTTLRPWSPLRLSASVHYGDDLRTTSESRETMEFLVYERAEGDALRRIARVEVSMAASPIGGHFAWCELDPPPGGWPASGVVAEARLRGMQQTRDRQEAKFESLGAEADAAVRQMDEADRTTVERPSSGTTLVLGRDAKISVPAGSTFLLEGFVEVGDAATRESLPLEAMILANTGPVRTEELRAEGLWMHANAYPTLWPAGDGRSWFQAQFAAPAEPGEYVVRATLDHDGETTRPVQDIRLTVRPAATRR